ncbi:hypothetical protein FS842_002438 [Serendipita sp. 407]|nr:hypothetical protein FS842_002438 [Serendipita sp. 407]
MEEISAVYRVPTEIWHKIFSSLLKTWLLPGTEDDILNDIFFFATGCKSYEEYKRVEYTRRQLRAVCCHWKEIADDLAINLAITKIEGITPISAERLDIARRIETPTSRCTPRKCNCFSRFWNRVTLLTRYRLVAVPASKPLLSSSFSLERVRVITCGLDGLQRYIDAKYVNSAVNLKALGVSVGNLRTITMPDSLTHLSILDIMGKEVPVTLSLPCLRYLHLHLRLDMADKQSPWEPFDRWVFPKLAFLCISGVIPIGIHHDGLQRFTHNHEHTIENLVLLYVASPLGVMRHPIINLHDLQQRYSRLKTFGLTIMGMKGVCDTNDLCTVDSSHPSLSLLLTDIIGLDRKRWRIMPMVARQCLSLCTPPTAIFNRMVMIDSWQQVLQVWEIGVASQHLNAFDYLRTPCNFFRELYKTNIVFVDKDGVELREGDGLKLLERLGLTDFD